MIYDEANTSSQHNVQPIDFYRKIWTKLCSYCKSDRERAYVLFTLADHELIPYRNVGIGISMSEKDFSAGIKIIKDKLFEDTRYILKLSYEQKTQYASLILDKLLSLEDKNLQTIYLSMIIKFVEKDLKDRIKDFVEDA